MTDLVGARHVLIVAQEEDVIAGFMELGTMPSLVSSREMPYLANLAVGKEYRRRKMGSTLVKLALKISTKWCPEEEDNADAAIYLAVEKDNREAVSFYDKMRFLCVIDETQRRAKKGRKRKPRLYFEKKLYPDDDVT